MISKKLLVKIKKLYSTKYNVNLTDEVATKYATALVNLIRVLSKPDLNEELKNKV